MPEYRRFIAYFYEYIDGKKQKNTGFAKVELRNGTWRILFRLTAPVHPRPPVEVYGFVRKGDDLLGLPMGNMRVGREMMEEWAYHNETLWMGKYGLSDFSGIWIRSGDGRHFITVWDEEPVEVDRFVTDLPAEGTRRTARRPASHIKMSDEENREKDRESAASDEPGRDEKNITSTVKETGQGQKSAAEISRSEQQSGPEAEILEIGQHLETEPENLRLEQQQETKMQESELLPDAADMGNAENLAEEQQISEESANETTAEAEFQTGFSDLEKKDENEMNSLTQAAENEKMWEKLYKKSSRFQPFEDQEITACIRVSPEDILQLQRAHWHTGRNSFLMHGYYNYRHLLIGKTSDGKYVLGVPGIMNPQEKYLAVMFGFPDFKFSDVPEQNPAGGYWYRILEQSQPEQKLL